MAFLKASLICLIRVYQLLLSPYMGGNCRFDPSCSHYSLQAINEHRLSFSLYLIFKRLLRCHPFGGFGFDPVPKPLSQNKEIN